MSGVRRPCPDGLFPQWIDGYPTTLPSPYRGRAVSDSTRQTAVSFVTVAELWLGARSLVGLLPPRCREGFKHGSASGHRACFRSHRPTPGRVPSLELSTYALLGAHPPLACAASLMMSLLSHGESTLTGRTCRVRVCRSSSPSLPWVEGCSPQRTSPNHLHPAAVGVIGLSCVDVPIELLDLGEPLVAVGASEEQGLCSSHGLSPFSGCLPSCCGGHSVCLDSHHLAGGQGAQVAENLGRFSSLGARRTEGANDLGVLRHGDAPDEHVAAIR